MRIVLVVQAVVIVLLGVAVAALIPRALSYDDLLDDNLALRERVASLDRRMAEIDRILLRLRLYDAQLDGLRPGGPPPEGDHGPLPHADGSDPDVIVDPPDDDAPVTELDVDFQLRPADDWADAVIARADTFLAVFEEAEPDLNVLVTELEDLRALDQALPGRWPATGDLTSGFGYRRSPFGRRAQFHRGIDISDDRGTAIVAVAPGRVLRAFYNGGYGRFVEIDHGYGITTRYAHMTRIAVHEGDVVEAGQLVGTMGRTGRVTGTHHHFEVRIDGHAVDPMDFLPQP